MSGRRGPLPPQIVEPAERARWEPEFNLARWASFPLVGVRLDALDDPRFRHQDVDEHPALMGRDDEHGDRDRHRRRVDGTRNRAGLPVSDVTLIQRIRYVVGYP